MPAFRNGASSAVSHWRTNSLPRGSPMKSVRSEDLFAAQPGLQHAPPQLRAQVRRELVPKMQDPPAPRSSPHPDRRRQNRRRRPAASAPFWPASPASLAGAAAIHFDRVARIPVPSPRWRIPVHSTGSAKPEAGDAAPGQVPAAFSRASSPAGKGSDRSPPCRSGPLPGACHKRSRFSQSRIGGAHLNSVAPSGISSAANHR